MDQQTLLKTPLLCSAVLMALFATTVRGQGPAPLLDRVPGNAVFVMATDDLSATCAGFRATSLGQQLCGQTFEPLVAALQKQDRASPLHLRPWMGVDWPALSQVKEPAVFVIFPVSTAKPATADGKSGNASAVPGAAWLFAGGADSPSAESLRRSFRGYFEGRKWSLVESKSGDASLVTATPPASDKSSRSTVWLDSATLFGVVSSPAAADVLRSVKKTESLAANPAALVALLGAPSPVAKRPAAGEVHFWTRPFPLADLRQAEHTKTTITDPVVRARRLGLDGIQTISGAIKFSTDLAEWEFHGTLGVALPYRKALRALDLIPGGDIGLPLWIPGDAASASTWRWSFPTAMRAFANLFDETSDPGPDGEGLFDQILDGLKEDPEGPQVDLRKELFEKLGPEMVQMSLDDRGVKAAAKAVEDKAVEGKAAGEKAKEASGGWVAEAACQDEAAVRKLLMSFFRGDPKVKAEKIGNFDVWTVDDKGALFVESESKSLATIRGAAIGEGKLLFATRRRLMVDSLDKRAKGAAVPLAKTADWRQFETWRKTIDGKKTALRAWSRPSGTWREAYEQARSPKPAEKDTASVKMWLLVLYGTTDRSNDLPYHAAPPFDAWVGRLPPIGTLLSKSEGGWDVAGAALKPVSPKAP